MYISILGRQPAIGIAELERVFDSNNVDWFSKTSATFSAEADRVVVDNLGGSPKIGRVVLEIKRGIWRDASKKLVDHYTEQWRGFEGKITVGISAYGFNVDAREVQKTGIILKQKLRAGGISLRLIPNVKPELNTAASHHNKLGRSPKKMELLVVHGTDGRIIIAESLGAQNISALVRRDQLRPARDAFVGMLPPKLAQIIINLTASKPGARILDPFCGTGTILQEAALMGHAVYGTDLSEKMIAYSEENLKWLEEMRGMQTSYKLAPGDAMNMKWQSPIDAVACEAYLGQPFSAPPSPAKLAEVRGNCNHIISEFLKNLAPQLKSGTPVCVAVPAWRDKGGHFTHLPLLEKVEELGYRRVPFKNIAQKELLYNREDQIVGRDLLVLKKA